MRVLVLGGTRFVGLAIAEELLAGGHEVLCVHRGIHGAAPPGAHEMRCHRRDLGARAAELAAFAPEAAVDVSAMSARDAQTALSALPAGLRLVAISSIDVYRAFEGIWSGEVTERELPLTEGSAVRSGPSPDAAHVPDGYDLRPGEADNLAVERAYLRRGATVCRLPVVYGPRDYKRREDFILARVRAGHEEIPFGEGGFRWSRGFAPELARGVRLALESEAPAGPLNLCEPGATTIREWAEQILDAAGSRARLVRVPDEELPEDLSITAAFAQDCIASPALAERLLGWVHADPRACVAESVRWHLAHPPRGS